MGIPSFKNPHVLGVISNGLVSGLIQKYSKCNEVPECDRWTHVAAVIQNPETLQWAVVESHIDTGCALYPLNLWFENNKQKQIYAFEYHHLDPGQLIVYPREKVKYGTRGVLREYLEAKIGLRYGNDAAGVFCSELVAKCDLLNISKLLDKKPWDILPGDFQKYAKLINREIVRLN